MESPILKIGQGELRGCSYSDINGDKFLSFLGIPYAKPPLGELRFKAPLPAESWSGIRDATREGDMCYSREEFSGILKGSEDCLNLNIFTKNLPQSNNKLKPVMVYIHGGSFVTGSNSLKYWGPEFLMTEDIVLVTINYRLGVLGFLSLEDASLGVPGNAGLKDQALALKWVQENIEHFNGDPRDVTLFGQSAGGASVHYHNLSQYSKGLFHKVILQSGTALNCWATGSRISKEIAECLGYEVNDEKEALDILVKAPLERLFEAQEKLKDDVIPSYPKLLGPVIENPNDRAFITRNAIDIILSGEYYKVPMMIGYSTREGIIVEVINPAKLGNDAITWQLNLKEGSEALELVSKKIENLYFKGTDEVDNELLLKTDSVVLTGIMATVKNHAATSQEPIFLYRMSLDADLNFFKTLAKLEHFNGASHGDELGYLFKHFATPEIKPGSLEHISIMRFVKLWTNFAKYGNPTPSKNELGVTWTPVEEGKFNFLDIGKDLTVGVNPECERMDLWREIFQLNPATANFL